MPARGDKVCSLVVHWSRVPIPTSVLSKVRCGVRAAFRWSHARAGEEGGRYALPLSSLFRSDNEVAEISGLLRRAFGPENE
jgi:hypothetical protein